MTNNSREIYLNCKELIEKSDYASFADQFSLLIQTSTDENYKDILTSDLNTKLQKECNDVKTTAINLREFDAIKMNSLYETYRIIKVAFEYCKEYITKVDSLKFDSNNRKPLIENEISEIVRKNFLTYINNKTKECVLDENLKNTLSFLIGYNLIEELNENVFNILNELEIDVEDQLHQRITNSVLDRGLDALK